MLANGHRSKPAVTTAMNLEEDWVAREIIHTNQETLSTNVSAAYSCPLQCMHWMATKTLWKKKKGAVSCQNVCTQSSLASVNLELNMNCNDSQWPLQGGRSGGRNLGPQWSWSTEWSHCRRPPSSILRVWGEQGHLWPAWQGRNEEQIMRNEEQIRERIIINYNRIQNAGTDVKYHRITRRNLQYVCGCRHLCLAMWPHIKHFYYRIKGMVYV